MRFTSSINSSAPFSSPSGNAYGWDGPVTPGDSGSGSRSITGEAVGNVTHIYIEGAKYLPAVLFGTTIDRMLEITGAPLATASLVPDPLP